MCIRDRPKVARIFPELNFHLRWELYGNETGFLVFRKGRVRKEVITHCWTDPEDTEPFPFYMGYVTEDFDFKLEE